MILKPIRVLALACASLLVASVCTIAASEDLGAKRPVAATPATQTLGIGQAGNDTAASVPEATAPTVDVTTPGKKKQPPSDPSGTLFPEPSAMITIFCGMMGVGGVIWRRRRG